MPFINRILGDNTSPDDEENKTSGADRIRIEKKAMGESRLKGEDFGYAKFSEGAPVQSKSIEGRLPGVHEDAEGDELGGKVKRSGSNYPDRSEWASPYEGQFHSPKRYGPKSNG